MQIRSLLVAAFLCGLAVPLHSQEHARHATTTTSAAVAPAQRWATDAPLRKGMADIRAVVEALRHYEHGHLGAAQALTLATQVEGHIGELIANCRLEPQADAALHGIIARLLQGTAALKADPPDMASVATLRSALHDYPRLFDDPGWSLDQAGKP